MFIFQIISYIGHVQKAIRIATAKLALFFHLYNFLRPIGAYFLVIFQMQPSIRDT